MAITLANMGEDLFLLNRPDNRLSHDGAAQYFDRLVKLCRRAGSRRVRLRRDTDFSRTEHLNHWHDDGVEFVSGYDAAQDLVAKAEDLDESAWEPLRRNAKYTTKTKKQRSRRLNNKEAVVAK